MQRCQQTLTDSARYAAWHSVSVLSCHSDPAKLHGDTLQRLSLLLLQLLQHVLRVQEPYGSIVHN